MKTLICYRAWLIESQNVEEINDGVAVLASGAEWEPIKLYSEGKLTEQVKDSDAGDYILQELSIRGPMTPTAEKMLTKDVILKLQLDDQSEKLFGSPELPPKPYGSSHDLSWFDVKLVRKTTELEFT